jgi:hypothetical protein
MFSVVLAGCLGPEPLAPNYALGTYQGTAAGGSSCPSPSAELTVTIAKHSAFGDWYLEQQKARTQFACGWVNQTGFFSSHDAPKMGWNTLLGISPMTVRQSMRGSTRALAVTLAGYQEPSPCQTQGTRAQTAHDCARQSLPSHLLIGALARRARQPGHAITCSLHASCHGIANRQRLYRSRSPAARTILRPKTGRKATPRAQRHCRQ